MIAKIWNGFIVKLLYKNELFLAVNIIRLTRTTASCVGSMLEQLSKLILLWIYWHATNLFLFAFLYSTVEKRMDAMEWKYVEAHNIVGAIVI